MFAWLPLKWIDFLPPFLRNSPLSKALEVRNIGWPEPEKFNIISSAIRSQDPSGLSVQVPNHIFSDPCTKKDQWLRGNLRAYSATVCELCSHLSVFPFAHHSVSLYIDMKLWSSQAHCVNLSWNFESSRGGPTSCFLGMNSTRTPWAFRQFDSYSWSDCVSEYHLFTLFQVAIGSSPIFPFTHKACRHPRGIFETSCACTSDLCLFTDQFFIFIE